MAFIIEFDKKLCKKCGLCIDFCPKKVFDRDEFGAPIVARNKDCIGCRQCEHRCPDFSLMVKENRKLS